MNKINNIMDLSMEKMYELILSMVIDNKEMTTTFENIKHGKSGIRIHYFLENQLYLEKIIVKGDYIIIKTNPQLKIKINDYQDDKDYRKALMIKFLEENMIEEDPFTER